MYMQTLLLKHTARHTLAPNNSHTAHVQETFLTSCILEGVVSNPSASLASV